jgi:Bacterial Ig-like domain
LRWLTLSVVLCAACASPGMPPGGPPDVAAPQIVSIVPDSGTVGVRPKEVVFHFDEVVSERPPSAATLADLFIISPRNGVPDVSWHRDAITVKPSHGWQRNTAYTVIMRGGLSDLRGNVRNTGATTFFSTGQTIPRTRITGAAFDWVAGTPAAGALVEAFVPPDTLHPYVALVDSSGRFALEHIPAARYTLRAYVDRNKNLWIDTGEPWDSVSVALTDSARAELLVFTHDTVPPRIREVAAVDSVTLRVSFDKPVDPAQTLSATNFAVIGPAPDSALVPIVSAGAPPRDTTSKPAAPTEPRAPSTAPAKGARLPRPDSAAGPKPLMSRPSPISSAVIRLQRPLVPKTSYTVRGIGIRGLLGATGNSEQRYTSPAPPPPPTATPGQKPSPVPTTPPASPPPSSQ